MAPDPTAAPAPTAGPVGPAPVVGPRVGPAGANNPRLTVHLPAATSTLVVALKLPTVDPTGTGITGWYVSLDPSTPGLHAAGWKAIRPSTVRIPAGEGTKTVYAWAKSRNGLISDRAEDTTVLDLTPPTVELTAPATTTTRIISVGLADQDPQLDDGTPVAGVTGWAIVAGTSAPARLSTAWKAVAPTTVRLNAGNGDKTISAFVRDAAGNVSLASTTVVTLLVPPPTLTLTVPAATTKRATPVSVAGADPGGSGIAGYYLSESPTTPDPAATGWAIKPTTFTFSAGEGTKTLYGWVKDANGSLSERVQATTHLDVTAPTATLAVADLATTISVPVTVGGADAGVAASGVVAYAVVNGTAAPSAASTAWRDTPPVAVQLTTGNGTKTISAFTRDAAGNVSVAASHTLTMTLPPPSLTFTMPAITALAKASVTVVPSDPGGTGIGGYYLSESPTTPAIGGTGWVVFPGNVQLTTVQGPHTVYAWVKDKNGSMSERMTATTLLDSVKPVVVLTAPVATRTTTISITIDATDVGGTGVTHWAIMNGTNPPAYGFPEWKTGAPTSFTLAAGEATRTISAFARDAAGNVSVAATRTVIVDVTKPTATLSAPSATATRDIDVTVGGTDAGVAPSGVAAYALVEGTSTPAADSVAWSASAPTTFTLSSTDGTKTLSAFTRDTAGNVSLATTVTLLLDTTPPSISLTVPQWSNTTNPWVALDGSDGAGSGITDWAVVAGTSQPAPGSGVWSGTKPANVTISGGDGPKVVSAWSRDAVGNVSLIASGTITLDTVLPTVTLSGTPSMSNSRTIPVTLAGSDASSGIARWAVTDAGSAPAFGSALWKSSKPTQFTFSAGDGSRTVRAYTRDNAGNVSLASVATLTLDTTAPSITFTTPSVSTVRDITLTIGGSDATSGIAEWAVVEGTSQPAGGDPAWVASPSSAFQLPLGDGSTQITVFAKDVAGNVGSVTRNVTLDTTAPTASLSAPAVTGNRTISITVTGSDGGAGSGITDWAVVEGTTAPAAGSGSWVGSAPSSFQVSAVDGVKTVSAFTRDAAGFVSVASTVSVRLDTTAPTATLSAPASTTSAHLTIAVTVGGADTGGSGVAAWVVVEGTSAPSAGSPAWVGSAPSSFALSAGTGTKTISAFTRDQAGNVSLAATQTVSVTP
ncbi:MAG: hypothetical protein U0869_08275 [Chloroflexota bacterium]